MKYQELLKENIVTDETQYWAEWRNTITAAFIKSAKGIGYVPNQDNQLNVELIVDEVLLNIGERFITAKVIPQMLQDGEPTLEDMGFVKQQSNNPAP